MIMRIAVKTAQVKPTGRRVPDCSVPIQGDVLMLRDILVLRYGCPIQPARHDAWDEYVVAYIVIHIFPHAPSVSCTRQKPVCCALCSIKRAVIFCSNTPRSKPVNDLCGIETEGVVLFRLISLPGNLPFSS